MLDRRRLTAQAIPFAALATLGLLGGLPAAGQEPAADSPPSVPVVLITGANRGIGLEFTRQYAERGWRVIATARKPGEAAELNALAAKSGGRVVVEPLDVLDHAAVDALAAKYADQPIDILINNAGISGGAQNQMFTKFDYAVFDRVLETNTIGPMKVTEAFYRNVERSDQKKIVTVSSTEGSITETNSARLYFYRASKAAVNMAMKNLALQVKRRGVSVCLVNPGPTDTDLMAGLPKSMLRPVETAVSDMMRQIDGLTIENTGSFWDYDGRVVPW